VKNSAAPLETGEPVRSREYFLLLDGRQYDSKAIAGVAHKFAVPAEGPLGPSDFSGGEATVVRVLERLGFTVEGATPPLNIGQVYTWEELGAAFGFKPSLFQVGGGMISRPEKNALLLITHPGGARSFDYEDRWDGDTLIYTGRGKTGDQRLEGPNRDVAENRKRLIVLEAAEARQLRYLGEATCLESWVARAADFQGNQRDVWKFRLGFDRPIAQSAPPIPQRRSVLRRPRPFSAKEPPTRRMRMKTDRATPEEIAALLEQANREHHRIVTRLAELLAAAGWTNIEEIPGAVDLGDAPGWSGAV
jgi:hypothetical protein